MNNIPDIFSITRRTGRTLILDGAMGSMLQSKFQSDDTLWMSYLNITKPEHVLKLHRDYIKAGADIISTNTFRTNPAAFIKDKFTNSEKYCRAAVNLALTATANQAVIIAGSNAPAEDCYQEERTLSNKELEKNHIKHINILANSGTHLILNETFSHKDEIEIVCRYCSLKNIPFIISLYFNENLRILSGEKVTDILKIIQRYNPLATGFNCTKIEHFKKFFRLAKLNFNWGVYLNCGSGNVTDKSIACGVSPFEYGRFISSILNKQPSFVGACCGSSPDHIKQIKKIIDERNNN